MPIRDPAPELDRRHRLEPDRDDMRESWLWIVALPARGLAVVRYTWVDARSRVGSSALVFGPRLPAEMDVDGWSVGPLSAEQAPPHRTAVSFRGERIQVDLTFSPSHSAYAYSSRPEPFPRFFADDRLEQSGWASGRPRRPRRNRARRSLSPRPLVRGSALDGHAALQVGRLPRRRQRCARHRPARLRPSRVRGYVHRDGLTAQITDAVFDYELPADLVHRSLRVRCTDESGRITDAALLDPVFDSSTR